MIRVRLEGLTDLTRSVRACQELMDHLDVATRAGAQVVVNDAKRRAPVITGTLRRSIHAAMLSVRAKIARAAIGPAVLYGRFVELGVRGEGGRWRRRPKPYLRPAVTENVAMITDRMAATLRALWRRRAV